MKYNTENIRGVSFLFLFFFLSKTPFLSLGLSKLIGKENSQKFVLRKLYTLCYSSSLFFLVLSSRGLFGTH